MNDYNFSRNNLDTADSPYLRQHQDNPVWWQQWSAEVLDYAAKAGKPVLVSVGYSTCHWCHVMAAEAFSDQACAAELNAGFVCIKVDREERPDIDQLMMGFLVGTTGQGGWPLNVFMSPDLKPFYGMTYAGVRPQFGRPGFPEILQRVLAFYHENKDKLTPFELPESGGSDLDASFDGQGQGSAGTEKDKASATVDFARIDQGVARVLGSLDSTGPDGPRFPPHASLLYALHRDDSSPALAEAAVRTLDLMKDRGLHDHAGGGFFRYCVDRQWTIPHFEKMLYDQALSLWNYSAAARRFAREDYRRTASGIIRSLEDSFLEDGLFNAALDADTNHEEGATYLWTPDEIRSALSTEQAEAILSDFDISEGGNFEGRNHLIRRGSPGTALAVGAVAGAGSGAVRREEAAGGLAADLALPESALAALAAVRRQRPQPFVDRKKLSSWNALAGIALLQAQRHLGHVGAGELARIQLDALLALHWEDGTVAHASLDGRLFAGSFMGDHAAMLFLLASHHEDRRLFRSEILATRKVLLAFRNKGGWLESHASDFLPAPAESFDSPVPSSIAMAEAALIKTAMVLGEDYPAVAKGRPGAGDFRNFAALISSGQWFAVNGPQASPWDTLPMCTIQGEGTRQHYCYAGQCSFGLPRKCMQD
ncbi:MAG: thioredoxin domain-containing protein [Clostridia bacterium]